MILRDQGELRGKRKEKEPGGRGGDVERYVLVGWESEGDFWGVYKNSDNPESILPPLFFSERMWTSACIILALDTLQTFYRNVTRVPLRPGYFTATPGLYEQLIPHM